MHHVILFEASGQNATDARRLNNASGGNGGPVLAGPGLSETHPTSDSASNDRLGAPPWISAWGGALVGALVALRVVRRVEPLALTAGAFLCQMASMWGVVVPGPWQLAAVAIACAGFFMSLVNAPMQAFVMLRIPRDGARRHSPFGSPRTRVAAPVGLLIAGWALSQFSTRAVIAAVLAVQSAAVLTIVGSALVERSALQGKPLDSLA